MKTIHIFSAALIIILTACNSSTEPDNSFPTDARDFLVAGNPGTEIVFTITRTETDTLGVQTVSPVDTMIWTVMERNAAHPVGGSCVRIREENILAGSSKSYIKDSTYYSFYNNAIVYFNSLSDMSPEILLMNPLVVGTQWEAEGVVKIKSVGETVNTVLKPMKCVTIEGVRSSSSGQTINNVSIVYNFASEVFLARGESTASRTYPSNKTSTTSVVRNLIRYTKK